MTYLPSPHKLAGLALLGALTACGAHAAQPATHAAQPVSTAPAKPEPVTQSSPASPDQRFTQDVMGLLGYPAGTVPTAEQSRAIMTVGSDTCAQLALGAWTPAQIAQHYAQDRPGFMSAGNWSRLITLAWRDLCPDNPAP